MPVEVRDSLQGCRQVLVAGDGGLRLIHERVRRIRASPVEFDGCVRGNLVGQQRD